MSRRVSILVLFFSMARISILAADTLASPDRSLHFVIQKGQKAKFIEAFAIRDREAGRLRTELDESIDLLRSQAGSTTDPQVLKKTFKKVRDIQTQFSQIEVKFVQALQSILTPSQLATFYLSGQVIRNVNDLQVPLIGLSGDGNTHSKKSLRNYIDISSAQEKMYSKAENDFSNGIGELNTEISDIQRVLKEMLARHAADQEIAPLMDKLLSDQNQLKGKWADYWGTTLPPIVGSAQCARLYVLLRREAQ